MSLTPLRATLPSLMERLQRASDLMRAGQRPEAIEILRALVASSPTLTQAHRLLGVALVETGDSTGAERAFRAALALEPGMTPALIGLSELLGQTDRPAEGVALLKPHVRDTTTDLVLLSAFGAALQVAGQFEEAVAVFRRAAEAWPASAVAEHNLAGALSDLQSFPDSEAAARRAFAKGIDAPESWLVLAQALAGQGRTDEARRAYQEALNRRPDYSGAMGALARLIWMETGDALSALEVFERPSEAAKRNPWILSEKAKLLETMGDRPAAYNALRAALALADDALLHQYATQVAANIDPDRARFHAERAFALKPNNYGVIAALCQANLAVGRPDVANNLAAQLCRRNPLDQYALALQATAWRMLGDVRHEKLYDYDAFISRSIIDTPNGWNSLDAYLGDLAAALGALHTDKAHPVGQSLRYGTQTRLDLTLSQDPVIKAFFEAIDSPIRRHISGLKAGSDPLQARKRANYAFNGAWSVRLRSSGFHVNHVHPQGWLSSACHISLPEAIDQGREGWLCFGEPGIPTEPRLAAEHFIKPAPGVLVLFPSYMWHGTTPFTDDAARLTIAFDVVPA